MASSDSVEENVTMAPETSDEFAEFDTTHEEFERMTLEAEPVELVAPPIRLVHVAVEITGNHIDQLSGINVSRARIPA